MSAGDRRRQRLGKAGVVVQVGEVLELRQLLTSYGNAWADARSLSVSFPSDSTPIGAESNQLRAVLDTVATRGEWQKEALRAFQQWVEVANVNIGLVPDRGDAFGTVGLASNDPRFGEIRIGAFPQSQVVASAVPNQVNAGTWSGDIFLNSATRWSVAEQHGDKPVSPGSVDLFSVMLHEVGNSLGLTDSADPSDAMSSNYSGPKSGLTAGDVGKIRALYGARQDIYEASVNDTRENATPIVMGAAERVVTRGSLNTKTDVDYYTFTAMPGQTRATITLWAAGISLLEGGLEIRKASGGLVGYSQASSVFQNNVRVGLDGLNPGEQYTIRIDSVHGSDFVVGDYELDIDYRSASQIAPTVGKSHDSAVYSGKRRLADADLVAVDHLFAQTAFEVESGTNETLTSATVLSTVPGFSTGSRYEAVGTISAAGDRDFFRFTAPSGTLGGLNVDLSPLGSAPGSFDFVVMNSRGDRVASKLTVLATGRQSIQVVNPVPGETYVVGIRGRSEAAVSTGNYVLTVDVATVVADMVPLFGGVARPGEKDYSLLTSAKSQLFRIDLSTVATVGQASQVTLVDVRTQSVVQTIVAIGGTSSTAFVWLQEGDYVIIATALSQDAANVNPVSYQVTAAVVSDDEGPLTDGSTGSTGDSTSGDTFVWNDIPVDESPLVEDDVILNDTWINPLVLVLAERFYDEFFGP
jgi:hypothetical protein